MNGVVTQFHQDYPAYAKTQVKVVWVPWTNATADWTNALASGKNAPDVTELGNTETPAEASTGTAPTSSRRLASPARRPAGRSSSPTHRS